VPNRGRGIYQQQPNFTSHHAPTNPRKLADLARLVCALGARGLQSTFLLHEWLQRLDVTDSRLPEIQRAHKAVAVAARKQGNMELAQIYSCRVGLMPSHLLMQHQLAVGNSAMGPQGGMMGQQQGKRALLITAPIEFGQAPATPGHQSIANGTKGPVLQAETGLLEDYRWIVDTCKLVSLSVST